MVPNNLVQIDEEIQLNSFKLKIDNFTLCGFRFHEEVFITESDGLQIIGVRPWSDWPIVWEYFCNKGNAKAASLLRHLATHALESYLF
jgi:hypothetical protein